MTMWHKLIDIFHIVMTWLDAQWSKKAKAKKKADNLFKDGMTEKDKHKILAALWRRWRRK